MAYTPDDSIPQNVSEAWSDLRNGFTIKCLTQYTPPKHQGVRRTSSLPSRPEQTPWNRFLDKMSCLCDLEKAGRGVVALGADAYINKTIYWLALNHEENGRTVCKLLKQIMNQLITICHPVDAAPYAERLEAVADRICKLSINRSKNKICNYMQRLRKTIGEIGGDQELTSFEKDSAIDALKQLVNWLQDHRNLIRAAAHAQHAFASLAEISQKNEQAYLTAKHMIGRLCCWQKAAYFVASNARLFAPYLLNVQVKVVPTPRLLSNAPPSVESTVKENMARFFGHHWSSSDYAAMKLDYTQPLIDKLRQNQRPPTIHAEISLAHYCSSKGIRLVEDCIGVSKPLCYACKLYFDHIPTRYTHRQPHGNAWLRWGLPMLLDGEGHSDEYATIRLVRQMADDVRGDVTRCIMEGRCGTRTLFESTNGISSSSGRS